MPAAPRRAARPFAAVSGAALRAADACGGVHLVTLCAK
eukprot:gene921-24616_t